MCARRHSYDVARSGYINLLQPQDRRSLTAGDSIAVVEARARLLDAGMGGTLIDTLIRRLTSWQLPDDAVIADLGSGSGRRARGMRCRGTHSDRHRHRLVDRRGSARLATFSRPDVGGRKCRPAAPAHRRPGLAVRVAAWTAKSCRVRPGAHPHRIAVGRGARGRRSDRTADSRPGPTGGTFTSRRACGRP